MSRTSFLFLLISLTIWGGSCQTPSEHNEESDTPEVTTTASEESHNTSMKFPDDWEGDWKGTLEIFNAEGKQQDVPMELLIHPTDSADRWQWTIVYGVDSIRQERKYELIIVDAEKGHYQIDEKNSIIIDAYLINGEFISHFSVMGSSIITRDRIVGDKMAYEIISSRMKTPITTGGEENVPQVDTYPITVTQRAMLSR